MDSIFNILDYFDLSIDNLDLTKYYIYVLRLIDDRYYVGRTGNILQRLEQHFTGCGSIYTMKYKPIKIIEIVEELNKDDERNKTLEIMLKYGWEKVRGAYWCSLEINKPNEKSKNKSTKSKDLVFSNIDFEIIETYNNENKDVQDIGYMLKRSPSWIAKRLEELKIVKRKQLARGYRQYIESENYKLKCKINNCIRREKQNIKNEYTTKLSKENLLNIKNIIREKHLNAKQMS
jgi:predicted GIY-YIG superfamily endonuclease